MKVGTNKFKQALTEGRPTFGLWAAIPDPTCAEIVAGAGFDWVVVDSEHGPFSVQDVLRHLQVLEAYDSVALVRAVEGQTAVIKQLLDVGAQTLIVPMVESLDQAKRIVQAAYYPPVGVRGVGTALVRAARWNRIEGYARDANKEICIIAQIESVAGLENAAEIAAVEGIDAVFLGPADLSASMGLVGQPDHPDVIAAILSVIETALAAGKQAGVLAVKPELVARYLNAGARFVGVGADTTLFANAVTSLADTYCSQSE